MPKTPDEIKKGLGCCIESTCEPCCPYGNASNCNFAIHLLEDVLAYIRQLEAERDAAVADLTDMGTSLRHGDACNWCDKTECEGGCFVSEHDIGFKWRGVQKED